MSVNPIMTPARSRRLFSPGPPAWDASVPWLVVIERPGHAWSTEIDPAPEWQSGAVLVPRGCSCPQEVDTYTIL
jgi:hypothetical protein